MGEGTSGMNRSAEDLEHEVESIRAGMDPVIDELDHRRHRLTERAQEIRQRAPGMARKVMIAIAVFKAVRMFMRKRAERRRVASGRARAF